MKKIYFVFVSFFLLSGNLLSMTNASQQECFTLERYRDLDLIACNISLDIDHGCLRVIDTDKKVPDEDKEQIDVPFNTIDAVQDRKDDLNVFFIIYTTPQGGCNILKLRAHQELLQRIRDLRPEKKKHFFMPI